MHILSLGSLSRHPLSQARNDGYVMINHQNRLHNEQNPPFNNTLVCGFLIFIFALVLFNMMSGHLERPAETNWSTSVTELGDQVDSQVAIPWQLHPKL